MKSKFNTKNQYIFNIRILIRQKKWYNFIVPSVIKYEIDTKTVVVVKEHRFYCNNLKDLKLPKEFKPDVHYGTEFKALCNIMAVEEVISLEGIEQFI